MTSTTLATPAGARTARIVVLADGGPAGTAALAWAEADLEAGGTDRRMVLCRAGHTPFGGIVGDGHSRLALLDPAFYLVLRRAREDVGSDHVDVAMRAGHAFGAFADLAGPGDTVVVAAPPLAGSTLVTSIAAHARGPVVAVRPTDGPADPAGASTGNVVVGVDDGRVDRAAIRYAFDWADRHHATLIAVRAVPARTRMPFDEPHRPADRPGDGFGRDPLDTVIDAAHRDHPRVCLRRAVVTDTPGDALVLASIGAALVVVGSHRRRVVTGRLSTSVSRHVLLHARCTVAVVPNQT